jgi:hypothetical protein
MGRWCRRMICRGRCIRVVVVELCWADFGYEG